MPAWIPSLEAFQAATLLVRHSPANSSLVRLEPEDVAAGAPWSHPTSVRIPKNIRDCRVARSVRFEMGSPANAKKTPYLLRAGHALTRSRGQKTPARILDNWQCHAECLRSNRTLVRCHVARSSKVLQLILGGGKPPQRYLRLCWNG